ncbi:MAG: hypothetical protein V9G19_05220 [Tetrasphaera sp.]
MTDVRAREDSRGLQWAALYAADLVVRDVSRQALDATLPGQAVSVRHVLRHMIGLNRGLAVQLEGRAPDVSVWEGLDLGLDPRPHWWESARRVVAAASARPRLSKLAALPAVGVVPVTHAIGLHALDQLTHATELAATAAASATLDWDACQQAQLWASLYPGVWWRCVRTVAPGPDTLQGGCLERILGVRQRTDRPRLSPASEAGGRPGGHHRRS